MATTKLENMFDPQVIGAMISAQLPLSLKFGAIAPIDDSLEGRPGSTITIPYFKYIGDAEDVAEGAPIDLALLDTDENEYTIKKAGKGVEITDEAALSGYGDPEGEAVRQLRMSIASKVDNDVVTVAKTTTLVLAHEINIDVIDAVENTFVEDEDNIEADNDILGVMFMSYKDAAKIRKAAAGNWTKASDLGDKILVKGSFGECLGWQIVRSKKLTDGTALAIKPGALKTFIKRQAEVEKDRDIINKKTILTADEHYVVALVDESKCVKVVAEVTP